MSFRLNVVLLFSFILLTSCISSDTGTTTTTYTTGQCSGTDCPDMPDYVQDSDDDDSTDDSVTTGDDDDDTTTVQVEKVAVSGTVDPTGLNYSGGLSSALILTAHAINDDGSKGAVVSTGTVSDSGSYSIEVPKGDLAMISLSPNLASSASAGPRTGMSTSSTSEAFTMILTDTSSAKTEVIVDALTTMKTAFMTSVVSSVSGSDLKTKLEQVANKGDELIGRCFRTVMPGMSGEFYQSLGTIDEATQIILNKRAQLGKIALSAWAQDEGVSINSLIEKILEDIDMAVFKDNYLINNHCSNMQWGNMLAIDPVNNSQDFIDYFSNDFNSIEELLAIFEDENGTPLDVGFYDINGEDNDGTEIQLNGSRLVSNGGFTTKLSQYVINYIKQSGTEEYSLNDIPIVNSSPFVLPVMGFDIYQVQAGEYAGEYSCSSSGAMLAAINELWDATSVIDPAAVLFSIPVEKVYSWNTDNASVTSGCYGPYTINRYNEYYNQEAATSGDETLLEIGSSAYNVVFYNQAGCSAGSITSIVMPNNENTTPQFWLKDDNDSDGLSISLDSLNGLNGSYLSDNAPSF